MADPKIISYEQPAPTVPEEKVIYVTKRDNTRELLDPTKLIKWNQWGLKLIGTNVPWTAGVKEVLDSLYDGITTKEIQDNLIRYFLRLGTWSGNRMAGILYAPTVHKQYYGSKIPTVKEMHNKMIDLGLMRPLPYTDDEYNQIQEFVSHDNDFNYAHFQIKHICSKYSLIQHKKKKRYETPQFIYIRMAMALCEDMPQETRMDEVRNMYEMLHRNIVNAPTPNYIYLGTPLNGLVSCCLINADDTIPSLSVAKTIAYRMTAIGAGIGIYLNTRGLGDDVRNGAIAHQGKLPYNKCVAGNVKANMQSGRAGACTSYYNIFDPEADSMAQAQNPRTPVDRRNRDIHFAVQYNRFFLQKAALDEDIFTFTCDSAPDLHQAFFSGDRKRFAELYAKYEADESFVKNYVNARDLLVSVSRQAPEVGTHYEFHADNANLQTPFKEKIYSSNLCVAPETIAHTDKGDFRIDGLVGQTVNVWNGQEYSEVVVEKTGTDQALRTVYLNDGKTKLDCTPYHRWYVMIDGKVEEKRTHQLTIGMKLEPFIDPKTKKVVDNLEVTMVIDTKRVDDTYCFTEKKRGRGMFNGIVTGQCLEIMEVTHPYEELNQLFVDDYIGDFTFLDEKGVSHTYPQSHVFYVPDGGTIKGGEIDEGDVIYLDEPLQPVVQCEVTKITHREQQPETALCSIGGLVVSNIHDDETYYKGMRAAQLMIDYCIHKSDYPFPQIAFTAKKRLNSGVGILGLATVLARKGFNYDSKEGLALIHEVSERHMYFAIKSSIQLGRERGNAPWSNKTKWRNGWLPIDDYSKRVDQITPHVLRYDWEALRAELIANRGMRFSCLVAHMPTESSSKAAGCPNGLYPIRGLSLAKSDSSNLIDWVATDSDKPGVRYQIAWELDSYKMLNAYAPVQKFSDQGISSDTYMDRSKDPNISAIDLVKIPAITNLIGLKTHYYTNVRTDDDGLAALSNAAAGCSSGACSL